MRRRAENSQIHCRTHGTEDKRLDLVQGQIVHGRDIDSAQQIADQKLPRLFGSASGHKLLDNKRPRCVFFCQSAESQSNASGITARDNDRHHVHRLLLRRTLLERRSHADYNARSRLPHDQSFHLVDSECDNELPIDRYHLLSGLNGSTPLRWPIRTELGDNILKPFGAFRESDPQPTRLATDEGLLAHIGRCSNFFQLRRVGDAKNNFCARLPENKLSSLSWIKLVHRLVVHGMEKVANFELPV
mmetsp:Transcript_57760/g.93500  ORF Transcript_57760/g.93500 Transcript_57760/m.93500 type:complete len:245 (-) Transcript_57760:154-888(-)